MMVLVFGIKPLQLVVYKLVKIFKMVTLLMLVQLCLVLLMALIAFLKLIVPHIKIKLHAIKEDWMESVYSLKHQLLRDLVV